MTAHVLAMALLGAAAAQPTYFTFQQFNTNDDACDSAATTATTTIWADNTCSQTKDGKESTKVLTVDNNVTITTYPNKGCNGTGVVSFSAPLNTCSKYDGQGGKFTASGQSYALGCSSLKAPYEVTYSGKSCTGFPVKVTAQTAACFDAGGVGGASSRQQCNNGTAQECFYETADCEGVATCDPLNPGVPTNTCSDYTKFYCPVDDVPFCPAVATTTKKDNNIVSTPIGGIVAAVILIPLIIIGVAVVIFVILRRNKASDADSSIMGGGSTTYGSA